MFVTKYIENNHPSFLIIPFQKEDIEKNYELNIKYSFNLKERLQELYPDKFIKLTSSGRKALELALNSISETGNKDVLIQTTSDNFYISSCVTKTIEKKNRWHRSNEKKNDVILINHEFGYADNRILSYKESKNLIEDCAFAFASKFETKKKCGTIGQYSIFSLSKFFPIQVGGILLSDKPIKYEEDKKIEEYISNVVGYYFNEIEKWIEQRYLIYDYYNKVFKQLNCKEYFSKNENNVPGVYLFKLPKNINADLLKEYYQQRGVQCSVFYKEQAFYLPLNQFTKKWHVDFFAELLVDFSKRKL
ncbi:MAG: hypothetical protein WDZ80_06200 [Candidatus Paceibacterota bacterium]